MIGAVLGGASLLGSIYSGIKGNESMQNAYNPYNIDQLRAEQDPLNANLNSLANQGQHLFEGGQNLVNQGQDYMDITGQQNQLMRRSIMGNTLDGIALQNELSLRNPEMNSGIARQNLASNTIQGTKEANDQFLSAYQRNMQFGGGLMGQGYNTMQGGLNTKAGVYGQQQGLVENMQQAMIANNDMRNQKAMDETNYWNNLSGSLLSGIGSLV